MRLVKLSTAAAVAAGLATSASAVELTEAIKGVDVSGYVRYRMEAFGGDDYEYSDNNTHKYKYRVQTTVPVNDDLNAVVLVGNDGTNGDADGGGEAALNEDTYGTSSIGVIQAYFQYTGVENLTVQAGKIPMPTPFNDDQHGNGLVGLYNAGPVTIGAGVFDSSNAQGVLRNELLDDPTTPNVVENPLNTNPGQNIMALGVIGSMGMVNASAWVADHEDTFTAYTLAVDADVMDSDSMTVNVGGRYSQLGLDSDLGGDDNELWKLHANADIDMFSVRAAYAQTDDEGGIVAYDTDAATTFQLENLSMHGAADADAYRIGAGATFGKLTASLDYMDMEYDGNTDADELLPAVEYQMSDNFNVRLFHSMIEDNNQDTDETQLELRYDF